MTSIWSIFLEWRQWRQSGVFIVNFEKISHTVLVFPLLTLNSLANLFQRSSSGNRCPSKTKTLRIHNSQMLAKKTPEWWTKGCAVCIQSSQLILLWRKPLSYRNQYIDLLCKLLDWLLYDRTLWHKKVIYTRTRSTDWENRLVTLRSCEDTLIFLIVLELQLCNTLANLIETTKKTFLSSNLCMPIILRKISIDNYGNTQLWRQEKVPRVCQN